MVSVGVATVKSTVYSHVAMKCELYKAVFSSVQFSERELSSESFVVVYKLNSTATQNADRWFGLW